MDRPGKGKEGTPVDLAVNYFPVNIGDRDLWIVHYVVRFEPPLPSNYLGRRFKSLLQERFFKDFVAYDGNENLYIAQQTAERQTESTASAPLRFRVCPWYRGKTHEMSLTVTNVVFISDLIDFYKGVRSVEVPRECLEALYAVVRDSASWLYWSVGKYCYPSAPEINLAEKDSRQRNSSFAVKDSIWGLWGYYANLCVVEGGLALNLDSSAMAFHGRICVSHYLCGRGIVLATLLRDEATLRKAKQYLAGLYVDCPHQLHARRYKIVGISHRPAKHNELFDRARQRETSIAENFQKMFSAIRIDPTLPCLILTGAPAGGGESYELGGSGPFLVPMDACLICGGQLFNGELKGEAEDKLRSLRGSNPTRRFISITEACEDLGFLLYHEGSIDNKYIRPIKPFQLALDRRFAHTTSRVIEQPALWNVACNPPSGGRWNLTKVYKSGRALSPQQWGILVFCSTRDSCEIRGLVDRVIEQGQSMGVECLGRVQQETICETLNISLLEKPEELRRSLVELKSGPLKDIVFLFCIADDDTKGESASPSKQMGSLARLCEAELGWLTKCCYAAHLSEAASCDDHLRTMALMVNAKLGGTNTALRHDFQETFGSVFHVDPVILFGTDVPLLSDAPRGRLDRVAGHHADAWRRGSPMSAVAAVVASLDWPHPSQYCARVVPCPDQSSAEVTWQTRAAMSELVDVYAGKNGGREPGRAVIFRQCAGDVEPWHSPTDDIRALSQAVQAQWPAMKTTWVDVRRDHHTKLFRWDSGVSSDPLNVEPGTVTDSQVVHPRQWDFYLTSHCATSADDRVLTPTYYRVVRDENGFSADEMEKFVYYLCHTFAAPTETTETVPPLYYVKLAAGYSTWTGSAPAGFPTGEVKDAMYFLN